MLHLKESWRYLKFIFDRKLFFYQHIDFYMNKAISMVKSMKILGNLLRGLILSQKCLLYKLYILFIMLYRFLLWFYNNTPLSYLLKVLKVMQYRATFWILRAFQTSLSLDIEAIAGLILLHLYLQKLGRRLQLCTHLLPPNYIINFLLEMRHSSNFLSNRKSVKSKKSHLYKFNKIMFNTSTNPKSTVIISNASIKNSITTSVSYIHIYNSPVIKTIHHATNIISTKAELFAIRCGLNQAICLLNIKQIIVITNFIHVIIRIFNLFIHPYQIQTASIFLKEINSRIAQVKTSGYFIIS